MAMNRTNAWLAVSIMFCQPGLASALYIELKAPGVAFAQGYPADAQAKVMSALTRPELKFLGGFGLNSHTSLALLLRHPRRKSVAGRPGELSGRVLAGPIRSDRRRMRCAGQPLVRH
jgi:hypothetical protein